MTIQWIEDLVTAANQNMSEEAREALWSRGVTDHQIDLFKIGFLDNDFLVEVPEHFQRWAREKTQKVFVLPMTNTLGEVLGLQVRSIYKSNSKYSDYYATKREACLFGLGQAAPYLWESNSVLLVEGAFDLLPIQRFCPYVVSTLTAAVSPSFLKVMRRTIKTVWMGYDMDKAGRTASKDFQKDHGSEFEVYIIDYPKVQGSWVKDPGVLWELWGDNQLQKFMNETLTSNNPFA